MPQFAMLVTQAWKAALKRDRQPEDKRLNVKMWRKRRSHGVHLCMLCRSLPLRACSQPVEARWHYTPLTLSCAIMQSGSASSCTSRASRSSRGSRDSALISSQHLGIGWDEPAYAACHIGTPRRLMFPGH